MSKISLLIELGDNGSINVTGPLHDKILCYGLIELAKQTIEKAIPKEQSAIIKPGLTILQRGN